MPQKRLDVSIGVSSVLSIHILYSSLLLVLLVRCVIINIEQYAEHEQVCSFTVCMCYDNEDDVTKNNFCEGKCLQKELILFS